MDGRHDGDTEIDQAALVANAETAVLRHAAFGDIELAHHLDAAQDGLVVLTGNGRHGLLQHTINAVLHMERVIIGFQVDIGRASLKRRIHRGVDQADDG